MKAQRTILVPVGVLLFAAAALAGVKTRHSVVDLFDTNTKNLIWRGSSSYTLSKDSAKNIKNLDNGVQKIFDHFPPNEKK